MSRTRGCDEESVLLGALCGSLGNYGVVIETSAKCQTIKANL